MPRRRGSSLGTSSRRSNAESDSVFRAALISGIRRFCTRFGLEVPDFNRGCDTLRVLYKECVMSNDFNCDYFTRELTKTCPGFNKEEFLRTVCSSSQRDSGGKKNDGM